MKRLALFCMIAAAGAMMPARAETGAVIVSENFQFYPGDNELPSQLAVQMKQGQDVLFVNADVVFLAPHSVRSDLCTGSKPCSTTNKTRLFDSGAKDVGDSGNVLGVAALKAGSTYGFHCSVHPNDMFGTLVVTV